MLKVLGIQARERGTPNILGGRDVSVQCSTPFVGMLLIATRTGTPRGDLVVSAHAEAH